MSDLSPQIPSVDVQALPAPGAGATVGRGLAFRAVFDRECAYVWTTLRRLGVAERDVEDVAHETFLRVAAHLHEYEAERPLRPWLFVFVFRMAGDYRRLARHRREVVGGVDESLASETIRPDEALVAREGHALIMAALEALDWDRRVVFVACELEEQEVAAVASALGIPRNTAASRLRLAREDFTKAIRRLTRGTRA